MTQGRSSIVRSLGYLGPYWYLEATALLIAMVTTGLALVYPWINKLLIDEVIIQKDYGMLRMVCILLLSAACLQNAFGIVQKYLFSLIGERVVKDIREDLLSGVFSFSFAFFDDEKVGDVMSTTVTDVSTMQTLYSTTLVDFVTDGLRLTFTVVVLMMIDWKLAGCILPALILFGILLKIFSGPLRRLSRHVQDKIAVFSGKLQESLAGVREIKSYCREIFTFGTFGSLLRQLLNIRVKRDILRASANGVAELIAMVSVTVVLFLGGVKAIRGEMQMGVLIAFANYLGALFSPVARLTELNSRVQAAMGSAERVFELLDAAEVSQERLGGLAPDELSGDISFRDVRFSYAPGVEVIKGASLEVARGETVALVGPSGAGKTTLLLLLMGFYDRYEGSISIDGVDVRDLDLRFLRQQMGTVFQEPYIFDLSVMENIRFSNESATKEEVEAAARAANAAEFIMSLPEGYDTRLGERGARLSGGQRQRIAIARAFLHNPRVLILDEATSALDSDSEALVHEALDQLMAERTTFVIAHRLATVIRADKIVVLDGGRIVEMGTHETLLAERGLYRHLYEKQFHGRDGASPEEANTELEAVPGRSP